MEPGDVAALFDRAVEASRAVAGPDDYEAVWEPLRRAAESGPAAAALALARLTSPDATIRATACDLLGVTSEVYEEVRGEAATALIALAGTEVDGDVQWSIARALGATLDTRALPVLLALARHADSNVRFQVAVSLPAVLDGEVPDDAGVAALIELSGDPDPEVRNWATFGFGWQSTADGAAVRQALWERTGDGYGEAREEGIRGLARRRDRRASPLLAGLLAEESAHVFCFDAAAYLGDPALLPLLRAYDAEDRGVTEALRECDPVLRARRDALALELFDALGARLPGVDVRVFGERFEIGLYLEVTGIDGGDGSAHWSVERLLERAGGDPDLAARLAAGDLTS
jgi:HEAT repeat protein